MESELIEWLRRRLPSHPCLRLGLGDDAAILKMADAQDCVITVDMLNDQIDFCLGEVNPRRVGRKCLAANLSDLAAMAAKPLAGVIALALPQKGGLELAKALYEGLIPLAEQYDLAIAGGDTNSWAGPLAVAITLVGKVTERGPLRRDGARPGDKIVVTGSFGGSILGRQFDFEPRVDEALLLNERYALHAGIDVSDGLSLDLARLARESGCGAIVRSDAVPVHVDAQRLAQQAADGATALDHALGDGEDFELILAVGAEEAKRLMAEQPLEVSLSVIGEFAEGDRLIAVDAAGSSRPLNPTGWQHKLD